MWEAIEQFFKAHERTIAALEAISTFAAVVVSLTLALQSRSANKTHIAVRINMSVIVHQLIDKKNRPSYLTASITNKGIVPVRIPFSFFHWRMPFRRGTWMANPHDAYGGHDQWVQQQRYPVEIPAKASHTFFVSDKQTFQSVLKEMASGPQAIRKWAIRFIRVVVVTDDGSMFRAKLGNDVRNELRDFRQTRETRINGQPRSDTTAL